MELTLTLSKCCFATQLLYLLKFVIYNNSIQYSKKITWDFLPNSFSRNPVFKIFSPSVSLDSYTHSCFKLPLIHSSCSKVAKHAYNVSLNQSMAIICIVKYIFLAMPLEDLFSYYSNSLRPFTARAHISSRQEFFMFIF